MIGISPKGLILINKVWKCRRPFRMSTSPLRRMTELLSRRSSPPNSTHANSNGRLAPNFLMPPEHHQRQGFIKDCLSPQQGESENCSPVLGHKTCAIHGGPPMPTCRLPTCRNNPVKVSTAVQTVTPLPDTPPPPPPSGKMKRI